MAYFIFLNLDNVEGSLSRIAETENDLNNLNIIKSDYKIIEDTQENFNEVKLGKKNAIKFNDNLITYIDKTVIFKDKESLKNYIEGFKRDIISFKDSNLNNPSFNLWNNYYDQLNSLNLDNITYPLNKSLEQYFNDIGQPSLSPLQLP
jgi:hypothetical protein